jgi:hypothetical protein
MGKGTDSKGKRPSTARTGTSAKAARPPRARTAASGEEPPRLDDTAAEFARALVDTANDTDPAHARLREEREAAREAALEERLRAHMAKLKKD